MDKSALLLMLAARLYSMGVELEAARDKLHLLVERGVSYDSQEMHEAYHEFSEVESSWKNLEAQYLELCAESAKGEAGREYAEPN